MRVTAAMALAASLAAAAAAADTLWSYPRGDAAGTASVRADGAPPPLEWQYRGKPIQRYSPGKPLWASPALAVVDGRPLAFIGGHDQTIHALDLAAKRALWRKLTNSDIPDAPIVTRVLGQPAVVAASNDRTVYALTALTGVTLWTRELVPPSPTLGEATLSAPLAFGGRIFVACFAYDPTLSRSEQRSWLFCLDPDTGRPVWRLDTGGGLTGSPCGIELDGRACVVLAARKGLVQAFDVEGEQPGRLWHYQMPHEVLGAPVIAPAPAGPLVILGSKYGNLVALDARTGRERWKRMAGNWIDNAACAGTVDGRAVVFAGSYDYCVYAVDAADGTLLWKRPLGGEIHTAPAFFRLGDSPAIAVGSLDNYVHALDARTGRIVSSWHTGRAIWDKISKGETLWGSPAVVESGDHTSMVYGSLDGAVYVIPMLQPTSVQARARSAKGLWVSLAVVGALFLFVVIPAVLRHPCP